MSREGYYNIDMAKTGALLKDKVFGAGYSVKEMV